MNDSPNSNLSFLNGFPDHSVVVCAHDAGAATHLASWLFNYKEKLRFSIYGPALAIFEKYFSPFDNVDLQTALLDASLLISGTGWQSDIEHQSRVIAFNNGIQSISVLDHWVNYESRFEFNGLVQLSDILWVSDLYAEQIAQAAFPSTPVYRLPNLWLDKIRKDVLTLNQNPPNVPARRLLYFAEPIRAEWSPSPWQGMSCELQALRYWLKSLPHLVQRGFLVSLDKIESLTLRLHPSEPSSKYDSFITELSTEWPITVDCSSSLEASLAWADIAFGSETQALIASIHCGLPAFTTLPPWAPPCRLPHKSLQHLRSLYSF